MRRILPFSAEDAAMTDYVIYYRVSTKKQSLGLEAQKSIVTRYLDLDYHDTCGNPQVKVSTYTEKESGRCVDRPQLKLALEACALYCHVAGEQGRLHLLRYANR
jgi:hypothetical protein